MNTYLKHFKSQIKFIWHEKFKNKINEVAAENGVPIRWPVFLTLIEESLPPTAKPLMKPLVNFLAKSNEPILNWIPFEITHFEGHEIELKLKPKPHLLDLEGNWDVAVITAASALPLRWGIQKFSPVGSLKIISKSIELNLENSPILEKEIYLRYAINQSEIESLNNNLLTNGISELEGVVNLFSSENLKLAHVFIKAKILWTPTITS